jgi:hypothetical protein
MTTNARASAPDFEHPLLQAPDFIRAWPAWAAWSAPTKRPLDLKRALAGASVTAPDTWASFDYALRHLRHVAPPVPYTTPVPVGVGILVAPPLVFVDFDDLNDSQGNAPTWATEFIEKAIKLGAFVERSAGGHGAHVFLRASPDFILLRNRYTRAHPSSTPVGIELYQKERFAALTGIRIGDAHANQNLNDPRDGDALLRAFVAELDVHAAPILTPHLPPAPLSVPLPTQPVLDLLPSLLTAKIRAAFGDPRAAYDDWQRHRALSHLDSSLSAWRFSLFYEACKQSSVSPLPVYELFNPQTRPVHPGVPEWQDFSGHSKKPHRKYADIQRAHALVQEEMRLLAMDLGEEVPRRDSVPETAPSTQTPEDPTWLQLGLVMKSGKDGVSRPLATSVNFIRVLTRHPLFAQNKIERNQLDGTTLFNRQVMPDTQVTRFLEPLRAVLSLNQDPPVEAVRGALEVIADDNPYDPLAEYLAALPKFAPPPDYDPDQSLLSTWLEKVGATPTPDTRKFARRILLGLVARALRPGVKFDYVPVFEGPQGIGKSTLVKALVGGNFYATLFGGLHSKDALLTLRGKWGVEISELAAFKKTDNETMKSFFSTDTDVFRPPYGRAMVSTPRRTVLFGTTNDAQYLTDHTGARRFWPIPFAKAIDIGWLREHRDALFAEAMYFFEKGEAFHDSLDEQDAKHRQQQLAARLVTPAWQLRILRHLRNLPTPHITNDDGMHFSGMLKPDYVATLKDTLDLPPAVEFMHSAQLASFLRRAGYVRLSHSYRPVGGEAPTKLHGWGHPSLSRLAPEEQRAFLANFPDLFLGKVPPPAWVLSQPEHMLGAIEKLKSAPALNMLDDGEESA